MWSMYVDDLAHRVDVAHGDDVFIVDGMAHGNGVAHGESVVNVHTIDGEDCTLYSTRQRG